MSFDYAGAWQGTLLPETQFTVYEHGTDTPATLYTDETMDEVLTNSGVFQTNQRAWGMFYAAPGLYDLLPTTIYQDQFGGFYPITVMVPVNPLDAGESSTVLGTAELNSTWLEPVQWCLYANGNIGQNPYNILDGGVIYTFVDNGVGDYLFCEDQGQLQVDSGYPNIGDRVVVAMASNVYGFNGVYTVTDNGAESGTWILTRSTDCDSVDELANFWAVAVEQGATFGNPSYQGPGVVRVAAFPTGGFTPGESYLDVDVMIGGAYAFGSSSALGFGSIAGAWSTSTENAQITLLGQTLGLPSWISLLTNQFFTTGGPFNVMNVDGVGSFTWAIIGGRCIFGSGGNPNGVVTANGQGDVCIDYGTPAIWQSQSGGNDSWVQLSSFPSSTGDGVPYGNVTPAFVGQSYIDTSQGTLYLAFEIGNNDAWVGFGPQGEIPIIGSQFVPGYGMLLSPDFGETSNYGGLMLDGTTGGTSFWPGPVMLMGFSGSGCQIWGGEGNPNNFNFSGYPSPISGAIFFQTDIPGIWEFNGSIWVAKYIVSGGTTAMGHLAQKNNGELVWAFNDDPTDDDIDDSTVDAWKISIEGSISEEGYSGVEFQHSPAGDSWNGTTVFMVDAGSGGSIDSQWPIQLSGGNYLYGGTTNPNDFNFEYMRSPQSGDVFAYNNEGSTGFWCFNGSTWVPPNPGFVQLSAIDQNETSVAQVQVCPDLSQIAQTYQSQYPANDTDSMPLWAIPASGSFTFPFQYNLAAGLWDTVDITGLIVVWDQAGQNLMACAFTYTGEGNSDSGDLTLTVFQTIGTDLSLSENSESIVSAAGGSYNVLVKCNGVWN